MHTILHISIKNTIDFFNIIRLNTESSQHWLVSGGNMARRRKGVKINCHGRNAEGQEVLEHPVGVIVGLARELGDPDISVSPKDCPHSAGGCNQYCSASGDDGVSCPYSFFYPHVTEDQNWRMPHNLATAIMEALLI